ncbi:MAG: DUF932 domain-containing protein [Bacteroidetes bacterium]|nr:DUF932 domain-containing protein [Bacteroidota bacterium]
MENNIQQLLEASLFPVIEQPCPHPYYKHDGWETQPTGYKYIMREDTAEIISCKTDEYMLVPNKRIIDSITPTVEELNGKLVDVSMFGNARTIYRYRFPQEIGIEDDVIHPEILIKNSYDGSVGIHILAGAFRLVCSNGMVIGTIVKEINSKHLVHNKNIEVLEESIDLTLKMLIDLMDKAVGSLMSVQPVNPNHIKKVVEMFPQRMSDYVIQQMVQNKPKNYWDLINTATYVCTHIMNRNAETTHKLEANLFDKIRKLAGVTGKA